MWIKPNFCSQKSTTLIFTADISLTQAQSNHVMETCVRIQEGKVYAKDNKNVYDKLHAMYLHGFTYFLVIQEQNKNNHVSTHSVNNVTI